MNPIIIQNIVLVVMLSVVAVGLSALKRKLLEVAQELSRKAPPVYCPVTELLQSMILQLPE